MLYLLSLLMVSIGGLSLILSLSPVNRIYKKDSLLGWRVLRALVFFFILGYSGIYYHLYVKGSVDTSDIIVAAIMLGGGFFVLLVSKFSLKSLLKLEELAALERNYSLHDSLTGLANRKYLMKTLTKNIQSNTPFSLLLIDLNRFKQINDALGHNFGDLLLQQVGEKITAALPISAKLFRLGGDEFSIIATQLTTEKVAGLITAIQQPFERNFTINNYELSVNAAIGITHFPANSKSIEVLLNQADLAMYKSKDSSASYTEYTPSLETSSIENVNIATRLRKALEQQEFELCYQPIMDLMTGEVYGAEALIRWPQADGSFIAPDKFIKIAEQSALINQVTEWVMKQIKRDMPLINRAGLSLCVHLNLSVKDIQDSSFTDKVNKLLDGDTLNNHNLMLEITESAMMTDIDYVKKTMDRISKTGLVFSVDDFGTGYSSLALLRDLPVKQIKIDRSFITNIVNNRSDLTIVKSTVYLAKNLDCSLVAEGVEDEQTETLLKNLGCNYGQGYYYSKPVNLEAFIEYALKTAQTQAIG
ncbi:putative bifunctional diguanylate cyclase/phosphodiesterase [Paraglaciecola sp. 2405UD69-4]|uniref:putative bifunctional diguanylate cyclase/phosphodiesterase n=1 Tax=Paraglaciecola sp. 2405UD69-4 TaxID=3391836 RepID=UPI0039C97353